MLNTFISTENMTKQTWEIYRRQGIGGSDVSAICGISKYKSAFQLWAEKTGNHVKEEPESEAAYFGSLLEPIIREEFVRRTGWTVTTVPSILQHPQYPFMLANVDGIVKTDDGEEFIFEAKTASAWSVDEWSTDYVPYQYQLQCQHYLAVTDLDGAFIAVLIGGNDFRYYFIKRDDELINMIIELEKKFWSYVENNIIPPVDGSDAAREYINSLFPKATPSKTITLNDSCIRYVEDFENYSEQESHFHDLKEKAGNELKLLIGDNESAIIGNRLITWKNIEQERFNSKRFEVECPDMYQKYLNKSSYRRFTIKQIKGDG